MARPHPALLAMARGEPIEGPDDPDAFLLSAAEHRMAGLVWSRLKEGTLHLPAETVQSIAAEDLSNTAHHMKLWSVLEEVTTRLRERGIGTVAFKGVTDEARWFDRIGERPCSDIDILIGNVGQFDEAIATLAPAHPLLGRASRIAHKGHIRAVDVQVDGVWVDIHVDPIKVGRGWLHPDEWMAHTVPMKTPSGAEVQVFDDEPNTALRLLHLGRDKFRYVLGLVELERMLNSPIRWEKVLELARLEGLASPVGVAAEIVYEELRQPVAKTAPPGWRTRLWRRLWPPRVRLLGEEGRTRFGRRGHWGLPLLMPGRTWESIGWMARSVAPPQTVFQLKHPHMRGPYAWRLTGGRIGYRLRRRSGDDR